MPIDFSEEDINEAEKEGGKGLRRLLEQALAENRELTKKVSSLEAKSLIEEKGFDLVKPEDLAGVKPDELEAKAQELQSQRLEERRGLIREMFEKRGYEGDALEQAVEEFFAPPESGFEDVSEAAVIGGAPVTRAIDPDKLSPREKLELAFSRKRR